MRKLSVFNFMTLNGFYKDANNDMSWHQHGGEESQYSAEMLAQENTLLFGRKTYELMESFWPTPMGEESDPVVAEGMNKAEKIVFSRTLGHASWNNTRIIKDNLVDEVRQLKQTSGNDLALLGSGSILTQLADADLVDEYQFMIDPVAIGQGTPVFYGMKRQLNLKLTDTKVFKSGTVILCYQLA